MLRAITVDGNILIGLTRSSLELLDAGETLVSPGYEGGPDIMLVFGETDAALRAKLRAGGHTHAGTKEFDKRPS